MKKKHIIFIIIFSLLLGLAVYALLHRFNPVSLCKAIYAYYQIPEVEGHENYAGVLSIPSVGIEVDCIDVNTSDDKFMQIVTDRSNCAAKVLVMNKVIGGEYDNQFRWVIADHNYQNFKSLKDCQISDTAFFTSADGSIQQYVVTKVAEGRNENGDLSIEGKSVLTMNPGGMILYTCKDHTAIPVYVVFLQPVQ